MESSTCPSSRHTPPNREVVEAEEGASGQKIPVLPGTSQNLSSVSWSAYLSTEDSKTSVSQFMMETCYKGQVW